MKQKLGLILAGLAFCVNANADVKGNYFRVWEGFQKPELSQQEFLSELPSFMEETVELYEGVLSNYIVVIPPAQKPDYIPDELALVALASEADYRRIRATPEGKNYGARHWDVFDRSNSRSARHFVDYQASPPTELVMGTAYDMIGQPIDWSKGHTRVFIGTRKGNVSRADFAERLQAHIELVEQELSPLGLKGYIVTPHEDYEVAYINWKSKKAHDQAALKPELKAVFADAETILDPLMYEEAKLVTAGISVETGKAYATVAPKKKKALIVLTSHEDLGNTGKKTGYYLPEVTHPFFELKNAGIEVHIASLKGGKAPMDESSRDLSDERNRAFLENPAWAQLLDNTLILSQIDPKDYDAILFAGGHGTMWDFPSSAAVQQISSSIYENGGVVAAVCHGPAALVNIRLSDGSYLIDGKRVTGFSNSEEEAAGLTEVMPFLLETRLIERGGVYEKANNWQAKVVVDERLVTGQNPASATGVGKAVAKLLAK